MNISSQAVVCGLAVVFGIGLPTGAEAETSTHWIYSNAAQACQLSIPTTDTAVAPRATGFRNPGTTGAFVICGLTKDTEAGTGYIYANLWLNSMDGAIHAISCTGVAGASGADRALAYVTKTLDVGSGFNFIAWTGEDFGGTSGREIRGADYAFSITCNLPPQVQIVSANASYNVYIGT